jgi:hypothetical protein
MSKSVVTGFSGVKVAAYKWWSLAIHTSRVLILHTLVHNMTDITHDILVSCSQLGDSEVVFSDSFQLKDFMGATDVNTFLTV